MKTHTYDLRNQYQQNRASNHRSKDHRETLMLCRIQYKFDKAPDENHAPCKDATEFDGLAKSDYRSCCAIAILIASDRGCGVIEFWCESDDGSV